MDEQLQLSQQSQEQIKLPQEEHKEKPKFDSKISRAQWIKRAVSACAMILAIAIYSCSKAGILK